MTRVSTPFRLDETRENSSLSVGPSKRHGSCHRSNSGAASQRSEPHPRIAIRDLSGASAHDMLAMRRVQVAPRLIGQQDLHVLRVPSCLVGRESKQAVSPELSPEAAGETSSTSSLPLPQGPAKHLKHLGECRSAQPYPDGGKRLARPTTTATTSP